jgi:hypothetical protein
MQRQITHFKGFGHQHQKIMKGPPCSLNLLDKQDSHQ